MRNSLFKSVTNFVVVLIGAASLVTSWYPDIKFGNIPISPVLTTVTVTGITFIYLFNNSNLFFLWCRRAYAHWFVSTVRWRFKYQTDQLTSSDIKTLRTNVAAYLREHGTIEHFDQLDSSVKITFSSKNKLNSTFLMKWDETGDDCFHFTITQEDQAGYKDVGNLWTFFTRVRDNMFEQVVLQNNNRLKSFETKSLYHLTLQLKTNPFYRLTLRSYDKPDKLKFTLTFNEEHAKVTVSNNVLQASTTEKDEITKILKNYITLSKVY